MTNSIDAVPVNRFNRTPVAVCVALVALVWIVFGQTLRHGFINFDDNKYVYENAQVSSGLTYHGFVWAVTHAHSENWHPLTTLTHMLDCQLFGLNAAGHHFTNVLWQSVVAVLLFLALRELTGSRWRSAFVAAVFAIHPLRVESVAWIAARKDVLSGVFFAALLLAYARYAGVSTRSRFLSVTVLFACGLMSKPTLVILPFLLLLLDYWPLERKQTWRRLIIEKVPLLALSAISCALTLWAQRPTISSLGGLPLSWRIENAIVSVFVYLKQLVWPTSLALFYPHPRGDQNGWLVGSAAV